jgi:hypothetical protein
VQGVLGGGAVVKAGLGGIAGGGLNWGQLELELANALERLLYQKLLYGQLVGVFQR